MGRCRAAPEAAAEPGIVVVRVESGLFFVNADFVRQRIRDTVTPQTWAVVLDGETSPTIDTTAATMLSQLTDELTRLGITLLVARHIGQVRDVLQTAGAAGQLQRVYSTVDAAVTAARAKRPPQEPDTSPQDEGRVDLDRYGSVTPATPSSGMSRQSRLGWSRLGNGTPEGV